MRSPLQFSLRSLLIAVTVCAVVMSMAQTIGVEATFVIVCMLTAVGVFVVLCYSQDASLVPVALCAGAVLLAALIVPQLICEWPSGHLLDAMVVAAVLWNVVADCLAPRGMGRPFDGRRKSRAACGMNTFPVARPARWFALAMMAGAFVLLGCAGYFASGEPFRNEAARAWPRWLEFDLCRDPIRAAWRFVWNVWPVNALAVLGVAAAVRVRCTPQGPDREVRLRHVANSHVVGLLMLSVIMLRALIGCSSFIDNYVPRAMVQFFPPLYELTASLPIVLVLFAASFLVLGANVPRYLREHGWLLAMGLGTVALAGALWIGIGMAMHPELL